MPYTGPTIKDLASAEPVRRAANMHTPISVWSDSTAREALELLSENKIHSVPVVDRHSGKYVGILDYFDLVKFISNGFEHKTFTWVDKQRDDPEKVKIEKFFAKVDSMEPFFIDESAPITTALAKLAGQPKNRHRALVVRQTVVPRGYLTEKNIVSWLASNVQNYGHMFASSTITDQGLIQAVEPASRGIKYTATAAEAFAALSASGNGCIAILGDDESLLASLSVTDIMGLTDATFDRLRRPVLDYMKEFTHSKMPPVVCRPNDSFEVVLLRLSVTGVGQFWVVDERQHPTGLVSISDVVQLMESKAK